MEMDQKFNVKARAALASAWKGCQARYGREVTPLDVLLAIVALNDPDVEAIFLSAEVSLSDTEEALRRRTAVPRAEGPSKDSESEFSAAMKEVLSAALSLSLVRYATRASISDLFLSILDHPEMRLALPQLGVDVKTLSRMGWKLLDLPSDSDTDERQALKDLHLQVRQIIASLGEVCLKLRLLEARQSGSTSD